MLVDGGELRRLVISNQSGHGESQCYRPDRGLMFCVMPPVRIINDFYQSTAASTHLMWHRGTEGVKMHPPIASMARCFEI